MIKKNILGQEHGTPYVLNARDFPIEAECQRQIIAEIKEVSDGTLVTYDFRDGENYFNSVCAGNITVNRSEIPAIVQQLYQDEYFRDKYTVVVYLVADNRDDVEINPLDVFVFKRGKILGMRDERLGGSEIQSLIEDIHNKDEKTVMQRLFGTTRRTEYSAASVARHLDEDLQKYKVLGCVLKPNEEGNSEKVQQVQHGGGLEKAVEGKTVATTSDSGGNGNSRKIASRFKVCL